MKRNTKPILVTGSHRSGSTWVGQMIAAAPNIAYVHEPFNIDARVNENARPFQYWFMHIGKENERNYSDLIKNITRYNYPLISNLSKVRRPKDAAKVARRQLQFINYKLTNPRLLIKDPIAFFSAEWLAKRFDMDVLILIRHPAAFCASLKVKNWVFDFSHFLDQPLLMDKYLAPYKDQIEEHIREEKDILDQAILLWNCIYSTVHTYQKNNDTGWLFIKHEDISQEPEKKFESIYKKLDLPFTSEAKEVIRASSNAKNPTESHRGSEFQRNSKANIKNWKNRLSEAEIDYVRQCTKDVSGLFYDESDW